MAQVEAVQPGRLVDLGVERTLVAERRPDVGDPRRAPGHAGELDRVVDE